MELTINPMRAEERRYTYAQSSAILHQAGAIGYLRGDFGRKGKEFNSAWFEQDSGRKTDEFRAELDEVINALRFEQAYGGLLAGRSAMESCGRSRPDSAFEGNYTTEYGFRIDTEHFSYLLRCNPAAGDYNFYCWCYERNALNRRLKQAEKGIPFLDSRYREQFRLPDGDKIRVLHSDGSFEDYTCRYIDYSHAEIGSDADNLYHVHQFAEMMNRNGNTVIPLRSSLPNRCLAVHPDSGELIVIMKGEQGYRMSKAVLFTVEERQAYAEHMNENFGITKTQTAAMLAGALSGWQVPAADPKNYDENGRPIRPKQKERGDAR